MTCDIGVSQVLVPREFLCLGFDSGDGLCAAFSGIFVGEDDVHENGTGNNGVDVLAEHLGLFAVTDAETAEYLGAVTKVPELAEGPLPSLRGTPPQRPLTNNEKEL